MSEAEPPREGIEGSLPKCIRVAVFEGRRALWVSREGCGKMHDYRFINAITVGPIVSWEPHTHHPNIVPWCNISELILSSEPDNLAEAEAVWIQAQELLRTGELE